MSEVKTVNLRIKPRQGKHRHAGQTYRAGEVFSGPETLAKNLPDRFEVTSDPPTKRSSPASAEEKSSPVKK